MFINKELLKLISKLEAKYNAYDMMVERYEKEIRRLTKQNRELMDRFMSRDFEQLKLYQTSMMETPVDEIAPDEDEHNAGEVLDLEAQ